MLAMYIAEGLMNPVSILLGIGVGLLTRDWTIALSIPAIVSFFIDLAVGTAVSPNYDPVSGVFAGLGAATWATVFLGMRTLKRKLS